MEHLDANQIESMLEELRSELTYLRELRERVHALIRTCEANQGSWSALSERHSLLAAFIQASDYDG